MENLYTTIADIKDVLQRNHDSFGCRTAFTDGLKILNKEGRLLTEKPPTPIFVERVPDDAFETMVSRLPIDASQILFTDSDEMFVEARSIPDHKDVFAIRTIPYVNDDLHTQDYFEVNYVYSGSCLLVFESEQRTMREGELFIISPFSPHNVLTDPPSLVIGILIRKSTFDKIFWRLLTQKNLLSAFFRSALYETRPSNYLCFHTENSQSFKSLIQHITFEAYRDDEFSNTCLVSLVNLLFADVLRGYSNTAQFYRVDGQSAGEFDFSLLLHYIQLNYRTLTLKSLAEAFHYSESHLSKVIKNNLNQNFVDIIRDLRMAHAAQCLESTTMKIHEISDGVGYESVDHFSRTFRKQFHLSPLEYRKKMKLSHAPASPIHSPPPSRDADGVS